MSWADLAAIGAFVLGVLAGGAGVIRVMRYMLDHLRWEVSRERIIEDE